MTTEEMRKKLKPAHYVYFIKCSCFIKIGSSINPWCRLNDVKTHNPFESLLLYQIKYESKEDAITEEKRLHVIFDEYRRHGEWFFNCGALKEFITSEKVEC